MRLICCAKTSGGSGHLDDKSIVQVLGILSQHSVIDDHIASLNMLTSQVLHPCTANRASEAATCRVDALL